MHSCPDVGEFTDTLLAERVDLVLHGHEHSYGRTHQLAIGAAACSHLVIDDFEPDCVVDAGTAFTALTGTVFATLRTGGTALRDIPGEDPELGYFARLGGSNRDPAHGSVRAHTPRHAPRPLHDHAR